MFRYQIHCFVVIAMIPFRKSKAVPSIALPECAKRRSNMRDTSNLPLRRPRQPTERKHENRNPLPFKEQLRVWEIFQITQYNFACSGPACFDILSLLVALVALVLHDE